MLTFLMVLVLLGCVLLVLIILAQNPKGGGLSPTFGGGMSNPVLGAKKTTDVLEKATWYIGVGIIVVILFSNFFLPGVPETQEIERSRLEDRMPYLMHDQGPAGQQGQPGQQPPEGPGMAPEDALPQDDQPEGIEFDE